MKTQLTSVLLAGLSLAVSSASAVVLADYKMTANGQALNSALSLSPTTTAANVSATGLLNQLSAATTANNNYNAGTDRVSIWNTASGTATVSYAGAFSAGNYVTFSLTAAEGFQIALDSITFQVAAATSTATTKRSFYLVSETSAAAFSSSSTVLSSDSTPQAGAGGLGLALQNSANANNTIPSDYSVSLSSLGVIGSGETRIFRFYLQTETASQGIAFDDIVINGTVSAAAVPEPSAFAALAGVAMLGFATIRRRAPRR